MNITYTGKQEFLHPTQKANLEAKFEKISKLLDVDGKGEKQAHVRFAELKNQHWAEITLNYLDHGLVGEHSDPDQFTALNAALEKLEKQILKVRDKRRDIKKGPREVRDKGASANTIIAAEPRSAEGIPADNGRPKVFRVGPDSKPMTVEEAMLVIDPSETYVVYRDAVTDGIAVLVRRGDGNFDLVEC
jgi:putative sigma-54 modulation protein